MLAQNARYRNWECNREMMAKTAYTCTVFLPTSVSCAQGEVAAQVFNDHRNSLYKEASYKPCIIASNDTGGLKACRNPGEAVIGRMAKGLLALARKVS